MSVLDELKAVPDVARTTGEVLLHVWRHPANRGHRPAALGRAVRFQLGARVLGRSTITPLGHRSKIQVQLHQQGGSRAIYGNPPDYREFRAWERLLRPGDLFVDGGANVGIYSIWAAELGAEVIAIEPVPDAAAAARANAELNGYPIDVRQVALADHPQSLRFTSGHDAMNHVNPDGDLQVEADTLDRILAGRRACVKLDLEGTELAALHGATDSLSNQRISVMQVEWSGPIPGWPTPDRAATCDLLEGFGYRFHRADGTGHLHRCDPTDLGDDVFVVSEAH